MSADPLSVDLRLTPHYTPGRDGRRPVAIVVHTNVGSFDSTIGWFADARSGVSAHYLVALDGRVVQFVDERDTARHTGRVKDARVDFVTDENPNPYTIRIEFEDGRAPDDAVRPAAQYAAGALIISAAAERWGIPLDRRHVVGHREIDAGKTCPGNLDIDRLVRAAQQARKRAATARRGKPRTPNVICLVPARNAAADLPEFLSSVAPIADSVVALDDGSTDETRELLESSPLVRLVLENPVRSGYDAWDDGRNRARLLDAAAALEPDWILSLDVDERIPDGDADALRGFIESDAVPGLAFGFQHFRMWGKTAYDPEYCWVYRLFAYRPGLAFPQRRLHFNPIPTSISRAAWVRTTIRLQHFGAASDEARLARLEKYRQADPDGVHQIDFSGMDRPPADELLEWEPRPTDLAVIAPPGTAPGKLTAAHIRASRSQQ